MKSEECRKIIEKNHKYLMENFEYFPIVVKEYNGSIITDYDNNTFIDFLSSACSMNLGGKHPEITKAIISQLNKFSQYVMGYIPNYEAGEYARLLTSVYPCGIKAKVAFTNSGSEANDTAIKYARAFTKRQKIISFINSYHGTTYGSISISGCTNRMKNQIGPFLPEVHLFKFYGNNLSDEFVEKECTKELEMAFEKYLPPEDVAVLIIEIIQGDGGILPAHPIFIKKLYNLCKKYGILFIVDDIQQGFFRTGKMFSIENYEGIIPDGLTLGKSFGAGLVGGCFLAREEIINCFGAPKQITTLAGNALMCAAGITAFGIYYSDDFQEILKKNIIKLGELGKKLKEKYQDLISEIRHFGMSMGIELNDEKDNELPKKIIYRCYERGLLIITLAKKVLRVQPPLNIEIELLEKGFNIIEESMNDYKNGKIGDDYRNYTSSW